MEKSFIESTVDVSWKTACYAINDETKQGDVKDTALWEWARKGSTNTYPERVISQADSMNKGRFSCTSVECKTRMMP